VFVFNRGRGSGLTAYLAIAMLCSSASAWAEDDQINTSSKKPTATITNMMFRPATIKEEAGKSIRPIRSQTELLSKATPNNSLTSSPQPTMALAQKAQSLIAPESAVPFSGRANDITGRYALLRAQNKDTGCLLTIQPADKEPLTGHAQLSPACRDQGLVIYDPVSWRMDKSTFILKSRQGHETAFYQKAPKIWTKVDERGLTLLLQKM
jgi:Protease inhibitor Inh